MLTMLGKRRRNVQVGKGLGTILSSIFRRVGPIAKSIFNAGKRLFLTKPVQNVVKKAQDTALEKGVQIVDDVLQGKNVKASIKQNISDGAQSVADSALNEVKQLVDPQPLKPPAKKQTKKRKKKSARVLVSKKRSKTDIFNSE